MYKFCQSCLGARESPKDNRLMPSATVNGSIENRILEISLFFLEIYFFLFEFRARNLFRMHRPYLRGRSKNQSRQADSGRKTDSTRPICRHFVCP